MAFLEGKTKEEKRKIIIAAVLGVVALLSILYTFGGAFFEKPKKTTATQTTPTPETDAEVATRPVEVRNLPAQNAIDNEYASIPVSYVGSGAYSVPVTGRNIFAFWEPGDPTPVPSYSPTPMIVQTIPVTPPPTPDYKIFLSFVTPQSVYAGSKRFRLEVNGDKFPADARIIFNGAPLQTTFLSEQRLSAEVPESLISRAYTGAIMVDSPSTNFFSRQIMFAVQSPPKPEFEYIGMIARQHYNNDTAFFQKKGVTTGEPFAARLNDVVEGRFRVISISSKEVEFQDTLLGFRHKLELLRPAPGTGGSGNDGSGYDDVNGGDARPPGINPILPGNIRPGRPRGRTNPTIPNNPTVKTDDDADDVNDDGIEPPRR
ncbi:MAG: hypothetical protein R2684_02240 [Pyrinomonadaceae bacterium]